MNDYLEKLREVIAEKTGLDPEEVTEESYFEDDLNISEMELVEILTELEDIYQVSLLEEKDTIETVMDLIDLLIEKVE